MCACRECFRSALETSSRPVRHFDGRELSAERSVGSSGAAFSRPSNGGLVEHSPTS